MIKCAHFTCWSCDDEGKEKLKREAYELGFRNGYLDLRNGITLTMALYSSIPGYAEGYRDGQNKRD